MHTCCTSIEQTTGSGLNWSHRACVFYVDRYYQLAFKTLLVSLKSRVSNAAITDNSKEEN